MLQLKQGEDVERSIHTYGVGNADKLAGVAHQPKRLFMGN